MLRNRFVDGLVLGTLALLFATQIYAVNAGGGEYDQLEAQFRVWLDNREIGSHRVAIARSEGETRVKTEADFQVKLLFVKVFSYEHVAEEVWRGACLRSLRSNTVTNGRRQSLVIDNQGGELIAIEATERPATLRQDFPECVGTYAYWDLDRLKQNVLVNSQTGRLSPAQLKFVGTTAVPKASYSARQFLLETAEGEIELWYDESDQWVGLATITDGKRLVYRREGLPLQVADKSG